LTSSGTTTAMLTAATTPNALTTSLRLMRSRAPARSRDAASLSPMLHQDAGQRRGVDAGVCAQRSVRSGERPRLI
jgi:hypothetical protein